MVVAPIRFLVTGASAVGYLRIIRNIPSHYSQQAANKALHGIGRALCTLYSAGQYVVKIDLTNSQAYMTADCKSDSVLIPPRIYSRFTEYRLF